MADELRIVFAGTPDFAVPTLDALIDSPHVIVAVYTQPDRPAGRGRHLRPSPVKQRALEAGLEVHQPATLRKAEAQQALTALAPDIVVVVAYGLLLPPEVLRIPPLGCVNAHASLLPRWRGAAPIQRAIIAGDAETGITLMQMDEGLDTGDILAEVRCPIEARDTAQTLHDRLAPLGTGALLETLERLAQGTAEASPQNEACVTYAPKIDKSEAELDWSEPAALLERKVRAFNPWPVAQTHVDETVLRIWRAEARPADVAGSAGEIVAVGPEGIDVATGEGMLRIVELQPAGRRRMSAAEFLNARPGFGRDGRHLGLRIENSS